MRLSEYEAKQLLSSAGRRRTAAWVPSTRALPSYPPLHTPSWPRPRSLRAAAGKRGGVVSRCSPEELEEVPRPRCHRGNGDLPPAEEVLCEEMLAGERVGYIAYGCRPRPAEYRCCWPARRVASTWSPPPDHSGSNCRSWTNV